MPPQTSRLPKGALHVRVGKDGTPYWYAKWRHEGRQVKRQLGRAWVRRSLGTQLSKELGHESVWQKRRGSAPDGWLTRDDAAAEMRRKIREHAEAMSDLDARDRAEALRGVTLEAVADEWLAWAEKDNGMRHSTATDYRYALRAHVLRSPHFKDKGLSEIAATHVHAWWADLRAADLAPRTRNKQRQALLNVFRYAMEPGTYNLGVNPVADIKKVKEPRPGEIDFYEPAEFEQVARIMREGLHRKPFKAHGATSRKPWAVGERAREDQRDAALVIVLAFAGLRLGEALALRWRHVHFTTSRIVVPRSYSAGVEGATKSDKPRSLPMLPQVAEALDTLSKRGAFTDRDDLVFANDEGTYLDPSSFRKRYKKACDKAGLRPLRVHDLRHGFLSIAAQQFAAHEVQRLAGHADVRTTARYMHAKESPHEVERLAAAFTRGTPADATLVDTARAEAA